MADDRDPVAKTGEPNGDDAAVAAAATFSRGGSAARLRQAAKLWALARWTEASPRRTFANLLRGWAPGALIVLLFCAAVLVGAFRASGRYYDHRLIAADSSCYLTGPALIVSGKNDFRLRNLLNDAAPLHSSDKGTSIYVLHNFVAWYLRAFLPLRPSMAVVLNGVWFAAMGLSVYALFWSRIRRWATAALATVAFLLANPFLPTTGYGLTALDPNLVGFMLGTSALCCVLLSDRFESLVASVFAGIFLGALALGRVYSLGVVLPAMLPYVLSCFWRRSREQIERSLMGGLFAIGSAYVVCGWWVRRYWQAALAYPTQFGDRGVLNRTSVVSGFFEWLHFPRVAFARTVVLICVLSWPLGVALLGPRHGGFRRFNWGALWLALCPLLVLAKMGTTFKPYGTVSLLGLFLLLLFPFKAARPELVSRGRFAAALSIACALSIGAFFGELRATHDANNNNKRGTTTALELMRQHATAAGRKRVRLGLIHWGTLHDASLVDALVFDLGARVATPSYQPSRRAEKSAFVVDPLAVDPWVWDPKVSGSHTITPEAWAKRLIDEADYVIVLARTRYSDRRQGQWPAWLEASEHVRASPVFERLGPPFWIPNDGPVELLVRKKLPPS